ncbi:NIPSNAP family protein [Bosea sp. BK604]|uniref:NIPSNAP family protein n=1 Tax=Bosea sp. BK604 TaxID=2512180 RepID=UPI0010430892|nr:NIPSNAP family protein [Bosea sp. BK604]TCR66474.1 NIPSNAP protein [Bosea sp. BK604]
MLDDRSERPRDRVFELRRYRLVPGQRETLIELFDREFVETQEAVGMSVVGQFRDLDKPDHFVWFRGFPDMERRKQALTGFYTGSVWAEHGPAANATMLDSKDVLLLKPAAGREAFAEAGVERPAPGGGDDRAGPLWLVAIHHLLPATREVDAVALADAVGEAARALGARIAASLVSEHAPNTFLRLPVREGETVVVTVLRPGGVSEPARLIAALQPSSAALGRFAALVARPPEISRLMPTARSLLR